MTTHVLKSAPVRSAIWFVICSILQKGILYLTTPIFTRLLTPEQYGVYTMYQSWFSIITIVCTLNLSYNVFHRAMVKFEDDRDGYTSSMQTLILFITLIVFSTFLVFPQGWEAVTELPDELIFCMFLEMLFAPACYFWQTRQRFEYRYRALVAVTVLMTLAGTGLGVLAVMLTDGGALARIYPVVAVDVAVGAVLMVLQYVRGRKILSLEYWRFALAFNLPLLPHYLSTVILNQADRIMIGKMCGAVDAAVYGVAYSLSMAMSLFVSSVNSSLIPWTYQQLAKDDTFGARKIGEMGFVLSAALAALLLAVIGLGPELMAFLAPESYGEAVWVIPPVALSVLVSMYVWLFVNVETFYEENGYVAIVSIGAAALNVFLNFVALPTFGFVAAGWTTLVSYVAMACGHAFFMSRVQSRHGGCPVYSLRMLALLFVTTLVLSAVLMALYSVLSARMVLLAVLCVVVFLQRGRLASSLSDMRHRVEDIENEGNGSTDGRY